nr:MAG TPA: hypothetical protein [Crassvirales sp.]
MDVLKFLQGGNKTPNPEYNPKTKKGAVQPPTLIDYNPGTSISDRGLGHLFSRKSNQIKIRKGKCDHEYKKIHQKTYGESAFYCGCNVVWRSVCLR